jgi:hypothetical protein
MPAMLQAHNFWSSLPLHPEMEWQKLVVAEQELTKEILAQQKRLKELQNHISKQEQHIQEVNTVLEEKSISSNA